MADVTRSKAADLWLQDPPQIFVCLQRYALMREHHRALAIVKYFTAVGIVEHDNQANWKHKIMCG